MLHEAVGEALGALREEAEALGGLPRFLLREVYRQRRCGLLEFGYVVVKCATCGESSEVPFSCKSRLCPSCSARRAHETAVPALWQGRLRFTKTGDAKLEEAWATHLVWPGKRPFHAKVELAGEGSRGSS